MSSQMRSVASKMLRDGRPTEWLEGQAAVAVPAQEELLPLEEPAAEELVLLPQEEPAAEELVQLSWSGPELTYSTLSEAQTRRGKASLTPTACS
jgi:hypothetical protein